MPKGVKGFQKGNTASKGPQKKTIERDRQRDVFNKLVDEKWEPIVKAQIKAALDPDNNQARHYLMDQRFGKPKEEIEMSGGVTLIIDF